MTKPTKLGSALAGKHEPASVSRFQSAIASSRVAVPYTIPRLNVTCLMTIVGAEQMLDLDGLANKAMARREIAADYLSQDKYELQRAIYTLAHACLDDDPKLLPNPPPIGTPEEWGKLAPEIIASVWTRYSDLRTEHDPLADDIKLTSVEFLAVQDALKKKDTRSLRSFGLPKLIACMLIMELQREDSQIPKSSNGDSSPESSDGETDRPPGDGT